MSKAEINQPITQPIENAEQSEPNETFEVSPPTTQNWLEDAKQLQEIFRCPVSVNIPGDGRSANFKIGVPKGRKTK